MCAADSDDRIPGLARIATACHRHGAKLVAQLSHCGRQLIVGHTGVEEAVSASNVCEPMMGAHPRALRLDELPGDRRRLRLGRRPLPGRGLRRRPDPRRPRLPPLAVPDAAYQPPHATPTAARSRTACASCARSCVETRRRVGPGFALLLKLNGDDLLPLRKGLHVDDYVKIAAALVEAGIDAVEVSVGHYESGFPMTAGRFDGFYRELGLRGAGIHMDAMRKWSLVRLDRPLGALSNRLWPVREGFNLDYARRSRRRSRSPSSRSAASARARRWSAPSPRAPPTRSPAAAASSPIPSSTSICATSTPGPQCDSCNLCLARSGTGPVDCWNPVRAGREGEAPRRANSQR